MIEEVLNNSVGTVEEVMNSSITTLSETMTEFGKTLRWLEAVGLLVFLWLVFQVITLIMNRKKRKAIYVIRDDIKRLEKKLDRVLKRKRE